jgi:hypothetical protein
MIPGIKQALTTVNDLLDGPMGGGFLGGFGGGPDASFMDAFAAMMDEYEDGFGFDDDDDDDDDAWEPRPSPPPKPRPKKKKR